MSPLVLTTTSTAYALQGGAVGTACGSVPTASLARAARYAALGVAFALVPGRRRHPGQVRGRRGELAQALLDQVAQRADAGRV